MLTKATIRHPICGHETKPCEQRGTHEDEASTGALSVLTSFTLSITAASNLARVITDVSFEATTAADNGSGQTSAEHNNNYSVSCQPSHTDSHK